MNEYDKELLKNSPSLIKGIAVQINQLNSYRTVSLPLNDAILMVSFGLALIGQIVEADKTNTGKLITECAIGSALIGCFVGLLAANIAKKQNYGNTTIYPTANDYN